MERSASAPAAQEQSVALHEAEVAVLRGGSGPPLLYLHGTYLAGRWLELHERLAAAADVVYPVHPGFREGEAPPWLQSFEDLVLLYRDLLDALELERVAVVGQGIGGWLAALLAVADRARVASLVVLAPLGLRVPGHPPADFLAASPARHAELVGDEHLPDLDDPEELSRFYGELGVTARLIWERRYDVRLERLLPRIAVPALVVYGGEDRLLPRPHAERWAELLSYGRLEVVAGAGHLVHADAPERCAELVLEVAR